MNSLHFLEIQAFVYNIKRKIKLHKIISMIIFYFQRNYMVWAQRDLEALLPLLRINKNMTFHLQNKLK